MGRRPGLVAAIIVTAIGPWHALLGQVDSARGSVPVGAAEAVAQATPVIAPVGPPRMPSDVRGYKITDTIRIGGAGQGVQYEYARGKTDVVHVLVAPYQATPALGTATDTLNMLVEEVSSFHNSLADAFRRGDLEQFRALRQGEDDIHAAGLTTRGYSFFAGLQHRGGVTGPAFAAPPCPARMQASPRTQSMCAQIAEIPGFQAYAYYAVYAMPRDVVRIRAELPRIVAGNEQVANFAHLLIAQMAAAR